MDGVNYTIDKSKPIIKSLLKKQRENCAEEFFKKFNIKQSFNESMKQILNAPEPGGSE